MRIIAVPLFLIGYYFAVVTCEEYNKEYTGHRMNDLPSSGIASNVLDSVDDIIDKRSERYNFGLGRRAYTYTNGGPGVKRLPVYNFGLGKRASYPRPYSFGMGKRVHLDDDDDYSDSSDSSAVNYDSRSQWQIPFPVRNYDDIKRAQPYSFGLGKRAAGEEVERRSGANGNVQRYNFGLGRR